MRNHYGHLDFIGVNANTLRAVLFSTSLARDDGQRESYHAKNNSTYLSPKRFGHTRSPRSRVEAFCPEWLGHVVDVDDFATL